MKLHVDFEKAPKFSLSRTDTPDAKARANGVEPKPILRSEKDNGRVLVDSETALSGVPAQAWGYVLGNRSAIDWVLDQHKEKLPRDPVIRKDFNTYRFADHKEEMINRLRRVTTVSIETMKIVEAMRALPRVAATSESGDE